MRKLLIGAALLAVTFFSVPAMAVPNPVTCEGYPEKRVYLENQSWVSPQLGPASHPGTGKQGHIHVATCFPLHQTLTDDTLSLDIRVQLHNVPGVVKEFRTIAYQMGGGSAAAVFSTVPSCANTDCDTWVHVDLLLDRLTYSGWANIWPGLFIRMDDGQQWYNVPRWFVNIQNGKPTRPNEPSFGGQPRIWIGGDTWLPAVAPASNYSPAEILIADFPWNFTTGQAIPVSGIWQPRVWVGKSADIHGMAMIDPALHANPPSHGTMVYDGPGGSLRTLTIDTTALSNGPHRLSLVACNVVRSDFDEHCGVLVVPFTVDN